MPRVPGMLMSQSDFDLRPRTGPRPTGVPPPKRAGSHAGTARFRAASRRTVPPGRGGPGRPRRTEGASALSAGEDHEVSLARELLREALQVVGGTGHQD